MVTLDQAINTVNQLPEEQQEILIDILYRRHIEKRREKIAEDAKRSIAAFHAGELQPQSIQEIISELHEALNADEVQE